VPDLAATLDRCLDALKDGRNLHHLLRRHPGHRDELIDLLRVSADVAQLRLPAPDPAFKLRTRNLMLARAARKRAEAPAATRWRRRPGFRLAMAIVLSGGLLAGGVVAASAQSLPGDPLYQVKRGIEQAQLAVTLDPAANARLRLEMANRRLAEAQRLSAEGRIADALSLITAADAELAELGRQVARAPLRPGDADGLARDVDARQLEADGRLDAVAAELAARGNGQAAASVRHAENHVDQTLSGTRQTLRARSTAEPVRSPSPRP
jgi:Domain of unknown function (DUF5667)